MLVPLPKSQDETGMKDKSPNKSVETNRRAAFPFRAGRQFDSASCAPAFLSAAVAHLFLVIVSAAALPIHAFVTPHQSKPVAAFALFAFLAALLISLFQPPTSRNRWLPALLAFGLYMVHGLFPCA
jgi:hypothetical protein